MQLIRPTDIPPNTLTATDAVLTASNVATDDAPEYNNSTSYSIGDQVIVLEALTPRPPTQILSR